MPGGIWGHSGVWAKHATDAGIRISSFDSGGYGTLMLGISGFACWLQDIPRAFAIVKERCRANTDEQQFVGKAAMAEIERRRAGIDSFSSQVKDSGAGGSRIKGAVLIALNSSWDASALGLHLVFDSSMQWIVETAKFLLENTDADVVVRQHPVERLAFAYTSDNYRELLDKHFGSNPRLHFIAAAEPINSYALLDQVSAVVVYSSTIGMEATVFGKPVITASNSYYSGLGFVWKATDLQTYQGLLADAAAGRLQVTEQMREDARLCYYLTQCTNWIFSPFNPADFKKWSRIGLDALGRDAVVRMVLDALGGNVPVAVLNHRASYERAAEAAKNPVSASAGGVVP
jgi:hypothetical protein